MNEWDSIRTLKGVGEKTEALFRKIGVLTIGDLLCNYPRDYEIYRETVSIAQANGEDKTAILAAVSETVNLAKVKNRTIVSTKVSDETGSCRITWYNMPFLRNTLKRGMLFVFYGKIAKKGTQCSMEHPEIFSPAAYEQKLHTMQPMYRLTAGLTNHMLIKMTREALEQLDLSADYLPEDIRVRLQLAEYNFALNQIHFPRNRENYQAARRRLVFDEFLLFLLVLQRMRGKKETEKNDYRMKKVWKTEEMIESLPYRLTRAQQRVWDEIEQDLQSEHLMTRLVQGDVGSGKTILAFLAMVMTVENGYQSALMVPTEVLARQHYEALETLLREHQLLEKYHPVLLTGSCSVREKKLIYERISRGESKIIVGTHALIQEKAEYHNLALVITDEQHRFGVRQRETFSSKGKKPNVLVMSATPIPRTLGIILYGDLDISVVDELPAKRLPIKNCVVDTTYRPKAYRFIEKQTEEGHQVYVICPMVEESEGMIGENVVDYAAKLRSVLPKTIQIEILHGQMKAKDKNEIMERFAKNEIQVLVSTTVVEVGVNVPNATVMMVENAERFGLAQLHQLRGRVGRGEDQSYCIFVHGQNQAEKSERLQILKRSNDGFYIAGEDLKLRGPGDLLGVRQSGDLAFILADVFRDADLLQQASEVSAEILALDGLLELPQHRLLKEKLDQYNKRQIEDIGL